METNRNRRLSISSILCCTVLLQAVPASGQPRSITSNCLETMATLGAPPAKGTNPHDRFLYMEVPEEARPTSLTRRPSKVSVFVTLPVTEAQYNTVYEKPLAASRAAELNRTAKTLRELAIPSSEIGAESLAQELQKSDSAYVMFVGHNEEGHFRFLDGTSTSLLEIAETTAKIDRIPIFISCGSKRYVSEAIGTHREIGVAEALAATRSLIDYLANGGVDRSPVDIQEHLTSFNRKYRVAFLLQKGCAAGAFVALAIIIYLMDDDHKHGAHN